MDLLICLYIYLSIWLSYSIFIITILVNWDFQLQWWNISYVIRYVISENIISALYSYCRNRASQVALVVKHLPANAGDERDVGSIPGLRRSPGDGNGHPLPYSCWKIPWTEEPDRPQAMSCKDSETERYTYML